MIRVSFVATALRNSNTVHLFNLYTNTKIILEGGYLRLCFAQETFRTRALTTNATLYFREVYFETAARARSVLSYFVFCCFNLYHATYSGLQVLIYIHSISNMVFHKLTKAITQKIHVQCFTECIKPFYFHRTYFKGFMIYVPHLFHSYIDRTSSILSILTKLIVSCSFVTAVKFVIVKINAARKVA